MATNKKGRGWHGDSDGHARAGKLGGQKTAMTHDVKFYETIGKKGGLVSSGRYKKDKKKANN